MSLPDGIFLITARPVLRSDGKGPAAGTIVFARVVDPEVLGEMKSTSSVDFALYPVTDSAVASYRTWVGSNPVWVNRISALKSEGFASIPDVFGKPTLVAKVALTRDITQLGFRESHYFYLIMIAIFLLISVIITIGSQRIVLGRIKSLSTQIKGFKSLDEKGLKVKVRGRDELSALGDAINDMLTQVRNANQALRDEHSSLERRVAERTTELTQLRDTLEQNVTARTQELNDQLKETQRINNLMVNRELKMKQLKEENAELRKLVNSPRPPDMHPKAQDKEQ